MKYKFMKSVPCLNASYIYRDCCLHHTSFCFLSSLLHCSCAAPLRDHLPVNIRLSFTCFSCLNSNWMTSGYLIEAWDFVFYPVVNGTYGYCATWFCAPIHIPEDGIHMDNIYTPCRSWSHLLPWSRFYLSDMSLSQVRNLGHSIHTPSP